MNIVGKQHNYRLNHNEYWLRIPMPWKARYYAINYDEILLGRKLWMIMVSYNRNTGFHLRMGWAYAFNPLEPNAIRT